MWTKEKLALLEQYIADGLPYSEAAYRLGVSRSSIAGVLSRQRHRLNAPLRQKPWTPERDAALIQCIERGGFTRREAAKYLGASYSAVKSRYYRLRGSDKPRAKIDPPPTIPRNGRLLPLAAITVEVAEKRGLKPEELRQRTIERPITSARHECFYRARKELGYSFRRIATYYNLTHKAVHYGAQRWERGVIA